MIQREMCFSYIQMYRALFLASGVYSRIPSITIAPYSMQWHMHCILASKLQHQNTFVRANIDILLLQIDRQWYTRQHANKSSSLSTSVSQLNWHIVVFIPSYNFKHMYQMNDKSDVSNIRFIYTCIQRPIYKFLDKIAALMSVNKQPQSNRDCNCYTSFAMFPSETSYHQNLFKYCSRR